MPAIADRASHRTLYEILWACLVTIFACSWVAVHPNVPQFNHKETPTRWGSFKRRATSAAGVLLAPELMVICAITERIVAGKVVDEYNRFCESCDTSMPTQRPKWTLTHAFFLLMDGFVLYDERGNVIGPLTPTILLQALATKQIVHWPLLAVSREEIEDKSKGDFLTKSVVVVHTTWFVVQCVGRTAMGLPLVGLEVITLAFAIMNVVTYAMWWHKPQSVNLPIPIVLADSGMVIELPPPPASAAGQNMCGMEQEDHRVDFNSGDCFLFELRVSYCRARKESVRFIDAFFPVFTLAAEAYSVKHYVTCRAPPFRLACALVSIVFGSFQFFSRSADFPSTAERCLWWSSSIFYFVFPLTSWHSPKFVHNIRFIAKLRLYRETVVRWTLILFPTYLLARLVLFIVALSSLRLPPDTAFVDVQWSRYIPHFQ